MLQQVDVNPKELDLMKSILVYDRKELVTLNLFWIGFIIYTVSWTLSKSTQVSYIACQALQLIGMGLFIPTCISLIRFRFGNEYQKVTFVLFFCWALSILLRGLAEDPGKIKFALLDAWFGGLLYLVPIVMLFPQKLIYYKKVFDVIIILGIFYVLYDLMFLSHLLEPDVDNVLSREIVEYFTKTLSVPAGFLLLTYVYHSRKRNFYAIALLIITLFFAIVRARRGMIIMALSPLPFVYIIYILRSKLKLRAIIVSSITSIALIAVGIAYIINNDVAFFDNLEDRGTDDTRSGVEQNFIVSMQGIDWLVGRGMLGEYYSPSPDGMYRGTVETDYLNMILKGGLINVFLLLLVIVPAMVNCIFRSRNTLSKAAGFWIAIWMLNTYPSTVQTFTLYYILTWVAVGIGYSRIIRNLPDELIVKYFQSTR